MIELTDYTLEQVTVNIFSGGTPTTTNPEFWNGVFPWLSSGETRNRYINKAEKTITEEGIKKSSTRLAKKNDIIIASAGQGHTRGQTSFSNIDTYVNQSLIVVRANEEIVDSKYLFFNLNNRYEELRKLSDAHSSRGSLTTKLLKGLNIKLPNIQTQRRIVSIIASLDDKIELNNQMNYTLVNMVQAIFKEWFLDFNFPGFDGELVDGLPKGWRMGTIDDVSTLIAGGDKPRVYSEYETETHNVPIYSNGISNDGLFGFTSHPRIDVECVTVSARGTIGYPVLRQQPYFPIVRLLSVIPKVDVASAKYIFLWLKNSNIKGTGTTQQQLTAPDFKRFDVLIPEKSCVDNFTKIADNIYSKILENKKQIEIIEQIRSSLIPKLMTGKIAI